MPATPPERLRNPLRKLRVALGDFGQPLSQDEFARLTGLSIATVRGIENERRGLTDNVLLAIKARLWAKWMEEQAEWVPIYEPTRPYTRDDYLAVKELPPRDPYVMDYMIHVLVARFLAICHAATPEQLPGQIMVLNRLLWDHVREYLGSTKVDLDGTDPLWVLSLHPQVWGKRLTQERIMWPKYPAYREDNEIAPSCDAGGIYDFRALRRFNPAEYPERDRQKAEPKARVAHKNSSTLFAPKPAKTLKTGKKKAA
jgi:hypothetical protein